MTRPLQRIVTDRLYKNPCVWFYLDGGEVVAYNGYQQRQFKIEPEYLERLKFWDAGGQGEIFPIDHELLKANLLIEAPLEGYMEWQGDPLSFFFHSAVKNSLQSTPALSELDVCREYIAFSNTREMPPPRYVPPLLGDKILLPAPNVYFLTDCSLWKSLQERFTCRNFNGLPITPEQLSTILYAGGGYIHGKDWNDLEEKGFTVFGSRKSSPSIGGLETFDMYVSVLAVDGFQNGIYYYFPEDHSLGLVKEGFSGEDLSYVTGDQFWTKEIACGIFLVIDLRRIWAKDLTARGYAVAYAEAGHVSQTLLLVETALKLQTWLTGTFRDRVLIQHLNLDERYTSPVFFNGFGHGTASGVPEKIVSFLEK